LQCRQLLRRGLFVARRRLKVAANANANGAVIHFLRIAMRADFVFGPAQNVQTVAVQGSGYPMVVRDISPADADVVVSYGAKMR
jgi:hypothetical protein